MGSCCEDNTKSKRIDDTAGGLVWVRRRNGSWWPGRILGLDELPESYSVSPRAGTPVKLLGREDGSMDWYNLEKSKRIKAFRCGEYDECIEKARASAVQSSRSGAKERKYARREDAILHALEIEQAHYMQSKQEVVPTVNRRNGTVGYVGLVKEQNHLVRKVKPEDKHKTKFSQSKAPLEQMVDLNPVEVHVIRDESQRAPTDSEDDDTAGAKRMRGLQEFGLAVASKRKFDIVQPERARDHSIQDNTSLGESNIDNGFSSMSTINSGKEPCSSLKKRTQVPQAPEALKRKNRRRQLTKVLESSATVDAPSIHEGGNSSHSSLHGVTWNRACASEPAETRTDYSEVVNGSLGSSETSCVEASLHVCEDLRDPVADHDDTDFCTLEFVDGGFLDIPVVWKEIQSGDHHGGSTSGVSGEHRAGAVERQGDRDCEVDPTKQNNKVNLKGSSGVIPQANNTRKCKSNSKEDAKGENNCTYGHRSRGSKKVFGRFEKSESDFLDKPDIDTEGRADNSAFDDSPMSHYSSQQMKCASVSNSIKDWSICRAPNVNCLANKSRERQVSGSKEVRVQSDEMGDMLCSTAAHDRQKVLLSTRDLPLTQLSHPRSLPRRQTHPTSCSCCQVGDLSIRSSIPGSALYDVELEVKASYQGRHVPLVSLMSKLNGKAIVGHPIIIEVLEDGCSNTFLRPCHVTRSNIDVCYDRKENRTKRKRDGIDDGMLWDRGGIVVKSQRTKCITKLHPNRRRKPSDQLMERSLSGRSSKIRKSGFLARKIRKLSSITVDCEHKEEKRKAVVENPLRPVACVPLKLVFSRINEALSNSSRPENQV